MGQPAGNPRGLLAVQVSSRMRPLMRLFVVLALGGLVAGCGYSIGDSCIVSTDCSADGTRICDIAEPDGYCTLQGCDYNTCPSDSECVRFFTGSFANEPCNYETENDTTDDCSLDELCSLADQCVPRVAEVRYCMATCSSNGDCRDGYECRTFDSDSGSNTPFQPGSMQEDGGEVVLAPGLKDSSTTGGFCAPSPTSPN
jgi:hypothetical protein